MPDGRLQGWRRGLGTQSPPLRGRCHKQVAGLVGLSGISLCGYGSRKPKPSARKNAGVCKMTVRRAARGLCLWK